MGKGELSQKVEEKGKHYLVNLNLKIKAYKCENKWVHEWWFWKAVILEIGFNSKTS